MNFATSFLCAVLVALFAVAMLSDSRLDFIDNILQVQALLVWKLWAAQPPHSYEELLKLRQFYNLQTYVPAPSSLEIDQIQVPMTTSEGSIPVLLVKLKNLTSPYALIISFHSGGFVVGHHKDPLVYDLAENAQALVASVGYRLAPEHKYPAAIDDCWDSLLFFRNNAKEFKIDPRRIAVIGASAGGNLAASISLRARDFGIDLKAQAVLLPMLRFGAQTMSYIQYGMLPTLSTAAAVYFWKQYVHDREDCEHEYCQPILARNLTLLAPAILVVGSNDPLKDEGLEYASLLNKSQVLLELQIVEGSHMRALTHSSVRRNIASSLKTLLEP